MRRLYRVIAVNIIVLGGIFLYGGEWRGMLETFVPVPEPQPQVLVRPFIRFNRVTYYNAVTWQTDSDPHISACGPNRPNQVAVSRDLFRLTLDCGDVIEVWLEDGYLGEFIVWDTMHPRFTETLDILTDSAYSWGRTTGYGVLVQ